LEVGVEEKGILTIVGFSLNLKPRLLGSGELATPLGDALRWGNATNSTETRCIGRE
jgi:hypothetical protein